MKYNIYSTFVCLFLIADGYAPFLSLTKRKPAFSEPSERKPAPGQYDSSPVKVMSVRDNHLHSIKVQT